MDNLEGNIFPENSFRNDIAIVANVATLNLDDAETVQDEALKDACQAIDEMLVNCKEQSAVLMSPIFREAFKQIRTSDQKLAAVYRARIKRAKPSGILSSDIFESSKSNEGHASSDSVAAELINMVREKGELIYDPKTERSYVTATIDGLESTMAINGRQFIEWISYQYYSKTGRSANETSIEQTRFALSGIAKYEGKHQPIYLRVAEYKGAYYFYVGDVQLRTVEVLSNGWRIMTDPPVTFGKSASMQLLPIPIQGGNFDLIWDYINVQVIDRPLVLAWILESLRSETPKPVLSLCGMQGCAKSSTQNKIRQLIDNKAVNLRSAPKSVQDIFVGAGCNWIISYENLSHLSHAIQDAFCTLATGGGFATRALYSDNEESVIEAKRPIIINSIPRVITAQDLTDRAICLELPQVSYIEEKALEKE